MELGYCYDSQQGPSVGTGWSPHVATSSPSPLISYETTFEQLSDHQLERSCMSLWAIMSWLSQSTSQPCAHCVSNRRKEVGEPVTECITAWTFQHFFWSIKCSFFLLHTHTRRFLRFRSWELWMIPASFLDMHRFAVSRCIWPMTIRWAQMGTRTLTLWEKGVKITTVGVGGKQPCATFPV